MDYKIHQASDGGIVIALLPGTAEETEIVIEHEPNGRRVTVDDVTFDAETGELTVSLSDGQVQRFGLSFLIPPRG